MTNVLFKASRSSKFCLVWILLRNSVMSHEKEEHNKILKLEIGSVKFVIRAQFRTIIPHVSPLNVRALLFKQINNLLGSICPAFREVLGWEKWCPGIMINKGWYQLLRRKVLHLVVWLSVSLWLVYLFKVDFSRPTLTVNFKLGIFSPLGSYT